MDRLYTVEHHVVLDHPEAVSWCGDTCTRFLGIVLSSISEAQEPAPFSSTFEVPVLEMTQQLGYEQKILTHTPAIPDTSRESFAFMALSLLDASVG